MILTCVRRGSDQVRIKEPMEWPDGAERVTLELFLSVAVALGGRVLSATFSVVCSEDS